MEIRLITYNIDGLPENLDLNTLPWILKPFVWVYKLFKKTTVVSVNDNTDTSSKMKNISERLSLSQSDIIGVQEDFNYHDELMMYLKDKYADTTHMGGFDLSKIFSKTECFSHFPLPRFKSDGLNMITNKERVKVKEEKIVRWKKSYGYIKHANDVLTHKGFRFYTVTVDGEVDIDIYIVHMDADFYNEVNCPDVSKDVEARESQLKQLTKYITNRYDNGFNNPIIIMGDTNSADKYTWDVENLIGNLFEPINKISSLRINEAIPNNFNDVDKAFYINNLNSNYKLSVSKCRFEYNFDGLSDHKPLVIDFKIEKV